MRRLLIYLATAIATVTACMALAIFFTLASPALMLLRLFHWIEDRAEERHIAVP